MSVAPMRHRLAGRGTNPGRGLGFGPAVRLPLAVALVAIGATVSTQPAWGQAQPVHPGQQQAGQAQTAEIKPLQLAAAPALRVPLQPGTARPELARADTRGNLATDETLDPSVRPGPRGVVLGPQLTGQVEDLLLQLDADAWRTRQRAAETLVSLGPDVLPRLRKLIRETTDEDVRARAEAAAQRIEDVRASGTSLITLHVRGASPKQVFAELARQANAEFRASPPELWDTRPWPSIDLDLDRKPFWAAMKEICDKVGVNPKGSANDREIELVDRGSGSGRAWGVAPSVVSGPFMVAVNQITRSHYVDLNPDAPVKRSANVSLVVYAEPKLRVLQGMYNAKIEEAIDDAGNSLVVPGSGSAEGLQPNNSWVLNLACSLTPQETTGRRLAKLKGTGKFLLQTRAESTEIGDVLNARNETRGVSGKKFTLKDVRQNSDTYAVTLTLYRSGWNATEWNFMYPYPTFRLVDAQGRSLARVNTSGHGGGQDQVEVTLHFARNLPGADPSAGDDGAGEPVKLVWDVPTETREVTVPFEFRDLPLP